MCDYGPLQPLPNTWLELGNLTLRFTCKHRTKLTLKNVYLLFITVSVYPDHQDYTAVEPLLFLSSDDPLQTSQKLLDLTWTDLQYSTHTGSYAGVHSTLQDHAVNGWIFPTIVGHEFICLDTDHFQILSS